MPLGIKHQAGANIQGQLLTRFILLHIRVLSELVQLFLRFFAEEA